MRKKRSQQRASSYARSESDKEGEDGPTFLETLFGAGTDARDDTSDYYTSDASQSESSDSREDYPYLNQRRAQLSSFESEVSESGDDKSVEKFDRDLRARHTQACKYMRSGKFAKALKKFENILASILERFGETHHRVGAALHNVGIANLRAGKLDDAMDAIEEAVRIRKLTLGREDPKVADSLVELGIILLSLKEYSDSLEIFYEALEMRESDAEDLVLPEDIKDSNLKVAKVLNNIGCVHFEKGNLDEAKKAFEDAIKMQKAALGEVSPFTFTNPASKPGFLTMASTMCNKGYIDMEQEDFHLAIRIFHKSLKIQKMLLGADNKLVLSTMDNIGFAYTRIGSFESALSTYRELHSAQDKSYISTPLDCADTLRKIVYVQLERQDYEGGLASLCALDDILAEQFEESNRQVVETRRLMGKVNYQVLKYPSAFTCFACTTEEDDIDLTPWKPKKPNNGSKMSGHRVTYA